MPHSMFGTRGQVRFRGKNSPTRRRRMYEAQRVSTLQAVAEHALGTAKAAKRALAEERAKTVFTRVRENVSGFVRRTFGRKTG